MKTSRRGLFGLFAGVAATPVAKKIADAMPVDPAPVVTPPPLQSPYVNVKTIRELHDFWGNSCICDACGDSDEGCHECAPTAHPPPLK